LTAAGVNGGEVPAIEEDESDDSQYDDDKFVYEDVAEDLSSDDPEHKFLKVHQAEITAR